MSEPTAPQLTDQQQAARWAWTLLNQPDGFVLLDSETTGLNRGRADEACQIAVIDQAGHVLLDTLVRPSFPIPDEAAAIHGISNAMVAGAPTFADVLPRLLEALRGRYLVIYNLTYDLQILRNMLHAAGVLRGATDYFEVPNVGCAMEQYAAFWGEPGRYDDYRWQRLESACHQQRVGQIDAPAHSALGDCLRTLALMKAMAGAWDGEPVEPAS